MSLEPTTLEALLSPAELAPYRRAGHDDPSHTLDLYDWNAQISTAFAESIRYLEIGLRNALDAAARDHLEATWLSPRSPFLSRRSRHTVEAALRHAGNGATRHEALDQLPFSFWVGLLAERYEPTLWAPALRFAFKRTTPRARLHHLMEQVDELHRLIAHHAPLHERDLLGDYDRILEVARFLAPALEKHLIVTSRVPEVLFCRPLRS